MARKRRNSEWHYHIRWLPSDLLDWQPFCHANAANRVAKTRSQGRNLQGRAVLFFLPEMYLARIQRSHRDARPLSICQLNPEAKQLRRRFEYPFG